MRMYPEKMNFVPVSWCIHTLIPSSHPSWLPYGEQLLPCALPHDAP